MKRILSATTMAMSLCLSTPGQAEITMKRLPLPDLAPIAQLTVDEQQNLLLIDRRGALWRTHPAERIASGVSPRIAPRARHGKIALADQRDHFMLIDNGQHYTSAIPLAPQAGMEILPFATIVVAREGEHHHLLRVETRGNTAHATARADTPVLPDAHPVQINFSGNNEQGHIAVLARPDTTTYRYGVLGDAIEAAELLYLERHALTPLLPVLHRKNLVFEANRLHILPDGQDNRLVSVMAGDGGGARTVVIGQKDKQLDILAQSEPLPLNRWQSPFVFDGRLHAVHMPHLAGHLVAYETSGASLQAERLGSAMSNHALGSHDTNLAAATRDFALIPEHGYRSVRILDRQGKLRELPQTLPDRIVKTVATDDSAWLLLANGEVWQVAENPPCPAIDSCETGKQTAL